MSHKDPVLIVDDDAAVRGTIMKILESAGICCEPAASAQEAVDRVKRGMVPGDPARIALALVDLRLGPDNGLELISKLRGIDVQLTALIVTGYPMDAKDHPDVDVVLKPFRPEDSFRELVLKVKYALEKRCSRLQIHETHAMMTEMHGVVAEMHGVVMHLETGMTATRKLAEAAAGRGLGDMVLEAARQPVVRGLLGVVGGLLFVVVALLGLQWKDYTDLRATVQSMKGKIQ